jgi:hypothetical protein
MAAAVVVALLQQVHQAARAVVELVALEPRTASQVHR